jgi:5-methylcytosine-specific restriction endonuclease McrA
MAAEYVPYTGPIVTRAEAKAAGLARYFVGTPCKRGHISERITRKTTCVTCKNIAGLAAYHADPGPKYARKYAWTKLNRAKVNEAQAARRELTKEKDREWRREWHRKNPERQIAASARYYIANAEIRRARSLEWYAANPEKASAHRHNRRARVRAAEGTHTSEDILRIGAAQKWKCHWCGKATKQKYHVDHLVPLSKGGSNWPNNLVIACARCNLSKHDSDPITFAQRMGLLI